MLKEHRQVITLVDKGGYEAHRRENVR